MTKKYLKKSNIPTVTIFLIWNIALFLVASNGMSTFWPSIQKHVTEFRARDSLFLFLTPLLLVIAGGLLPASWKDVLVFWKLKNTLPGCRFIELAKHDPRIDESFIRGQITTMPCSPHEENVVWYRWYKAVQDLVTVQESHKQFLLNRDLTGIAFLFFVFGSLALLLSCSSFLNFGAYSAMTAVQFLIFSIVARNHGNRFVCNVLVEYQNRK